MGQSRSDNSSKERLKWTQELHILFEKAVNRLGGPDTDLWFLICTSNPERYSEGYGIPGLAIFHVKSHLVQIDQLPREEDDVLTQKCNSGSHNNQQLLQQQNVLMLKGSNSTCWAYEMGYPWNSVASQSPLLPALYDPLL